MLQAKPLTFLWRRWDCLKWSETSISVFRHLDVILCMLSFLLHNFLQTGQNELMSSPQEQNGDWEKGRMLRIYIGLKAIKFYSFPPPPPHLYGFVFAGWRRAWELKWRKQKYWWWKRGWRTKSYYKDALSHFSLACRKSVLLNCILALPNIFLSFLSICYSHMTMMLPSLVRWYVSGWTCRVRSREV